MTDAQVKKYWKERERERRAPRVHQEGVSMEEKILRLFDMSSQFGVFPSPFPYLPCFIQNSCFVQENLLIAS